MCSNTGLSSGGCGRDNDGYGGGDSVYLKNQKKQKVIKRGPGVAELEKILREQEKKNDSESVKDDGLGLVSSTNSLPRSVSFPPNPKHFTPTVNYGNYNFTATNSQLGGDDGGQSGGGIDLQELWDFREPNADKLASTYQFPLLLSNGSSSNNFFHSTPLQKMLPSSSTTQSAGPCHGREPPSNQTSYHHSTSWPEEYKMVGEKRPRPFPMEIPPVPKFRNQVPQFSTEMNILDLAFSFGSNTIHFDAQETIPRDRRAAISLDPNIKKFHKDNGASCSNFPLFPSPITPQQERPRSNPFSLQECNGESQHRPTESGSIQKKPFYSFLLPREPLGIPENSNSESVEARGDGIDLNLRL